MVEGIHHFIFMLRHLMELISGSSKVTSWFTIQLKLFHYIVNIIHLIVIKLEIVIDILTIRSTPNEKHIGFNFAACNVGHRSIKYALTRTTKLLVLQDIIIMFPSGRHRSIDILKVERHIYQTIRIINITGMSTPGSRVISIVMNLGVVSILT